MNTEKYYKYVKKKSDWSWKMVREMGHTKQKTTMELLTKDTNRLSTKQPGKVFSKDFWGSMSTCKKGSLCSRLTHPEERKTICCVLKIYNFFLFLSACFSYINPIFSFNRLNQSTFGSLLRKLLIINYMLLSYISKSLISFKQIFLKSTFWNTC